MSDGFEAGVRHALTKYAYGVGNSVGPTTDRDGPQTASEASAETSATGLGVVSNQPHAARISASRTRAPGNGRGRGVPEWLRLLKHLPSPSTWHAGDKAPTRTSDQGQQYVPHLQPDGVRT